MLFVKYTLTGNDDRYVSNVLDVRYSVFESLIRSIEHGRLELHRKFPKTESLKVQNNDSQSSTILWINVTHYADRWLRTVLCIAVQFIVLVNLLINASSLDSTIIQFHTPYPNIINLIILIIWQDCMQRTIPYYVDKIVPDSIAQGKNVLIASSENAIRGLLMHLCEVSMMQSIVIYHLPFSLTFCL